LHGVKYMMAVIQIKAYSIQQTSDYGFIVVGYTASFTAGSDDFWISKLNASDK